MSKPKITETDISKLTPDPNNARKRTPLSASVIRKSLEQFGAARSIVVDENDVIRAGNGTFEEAGQLGIEKVVTIEVDGNTIVAVKRRGLTEEQWKKYAIADNTASDFSTWDYEILEELAQEVDYSEFFPDDKLNELLESLGKGEGFGDTEPKEEDEEEIAELLDKVDEIESRVKLGEIWQLGRHKLAVGDSTIEGNVRALLGNRDKFEMIFTDPPYGVGYSGGHFHSGDVNIVREREKLANDEDAEIYTRSIPVMAKFCDGPIYTWFADKKALELYQAISKIKGEIHALIIWHKINAKYAAMNAQYKQRHEPCLYWKPKGSTLRWIGATTEATLWEIKRDSVNNYHPTQKPTELAERAIGNHSANLIGDFFLGSGSTIIAAQKMEGDRTVYGFELSEAYCEIILQRFEKFTGIEPKLIGRLPD